MGATSSPYVQLSAVAKMKQENLVFLLRKCLLSSQDVIIHLVHYSNTCNSYTHLFFSVFSKKIANHH